MWALGIWPDTGLCAIGGGNCRREGKRFCWGATDSGGAEPWHSTTQRSTSSYWVFPRPVLHTGEAGREDRHSLFPRRTPITAPLPHQLPPRQGVVLPRPLHLHFPQVQKGGQEKRREERREPRASFTPTLHLLHVALDTENHPRTSLTPWKDNRSWGIQGQGLLHPITFTQKEAHSCQTGLIFHSSMSMVKPHVGEATR